MVDDSGVIGRVGVSPREIPSEPACRDGCPLKGRRLGEDGHNQIRRAMRGEHQKWKTLAVSP